jgi:hypothetical protein
MKRISLTLLLVPILLAGCARHYVLTLNNGLRVTSVGKPKLESGAYVFKDVHGQTTMIPAGRVREVAPASMSRQSEKEDSFNPKTSR